MSVRTVAVDLQRVIPFQYRQWLHRLALYASVFVMAVVGTFPLYWMAQNAFKTPQAILSGESVVPTPSTFTLSRFDIVAEEQIATYMLNSVIVTTGTIALVVSVSLVAGYGLARYRFRGKINFARLLLFGYMFSPIVLALPLYLIWDQVGLLNTHLGLILALSALSMPFSVWLMWKYIQTIPLSLEESAWVEGASRFRTFRDVIVPQAKPAIIANSLFAFAIAWNDFTFAQILLPTKEQTTFPPGILQWVQQAWQTGYGQLMAACLLMTIPPILFAYFLQSYLLQGFQIREL